MDAHSPVPASTADMPLGIPGYTYAELYEPSRLQSLYERFCEEVEASDPELWRRWDGYRAAPDRPRAAIEVSNLLIAMAAHVSRFVIRLFEIGRDARAVAAATAAEDALFRFKVDFVRRRVLPLVKGDARIVSTPEDDAAVARLIGGGDAAAPLADPHRADLELSLARAGCELLDRDKGSCTKGLHEPPPRGRGNAPAAAVVNPLGIELTGCPLNEKISEMHTLRKGGDAVGALALVTIDNPMCPGTGHRICNDCMKSCIYQKQKPVDIPQIETGILTDVLSLPFGFEIYGLLTRWNPLNVRRPYPVPYRGQDVLVVGLGPAGYTLAHHLLNEGFGVVGIDGLKLEPLPRALVGDWDCAQYPEPVR